IIAEVLKLLGIVIILFAATLPLVFVYMVVLGLGFGAVMAATFNMIPNYFGISCYPKIMGFIRLFWTFVGGAGAPLAGFIRENTGSYIPAFKGAIVVILIGLICLIFARPPVHPRLKKTEKTE
ncbi:MAG TPA: MFS transporter, partial [Acidobacteriota bacterium]|nr:MFS transporter [Acidobacteriota bacterium]